MNLHHSEGRIPPSGRRRGGGDEAEPLLARSLAIYEAALGADHPHVATSCSNLAKLHQERGDLAAAEQAFSRALAIREAAHGAAHPSVATSCNNLAALYQAQGALDEAEPLFARALELPSPDTYFADAFSGAQSCLRMSNYPDPKTEPALGVGAHTDSGILTLLGQSDKPGLELCLPNGRWVQPQPMPGAYLVNSGDLLRRWTNHRWLSTLHRVVNLPNQERYAIPFFWNTNPGAPLPLLALHSVFIQRFSDLHGMAWLAMTRRVCDGGATWMRIREQPSAL